MQNIIKAMQSNNYVKYSKFILKMTLDEFIIVSCLLSLEKFRKMQFNFTDKNKTFQNYPQNDLWLFT